MPDQISVSEFIAETTEDYNSPTTSSFTTRLHNCRNTVTLLEEVGRGRDPRRAAGARSRRLALGGLAFCAGEEGDVAVERGGLGLGAVVGGAVGGCGSHTSSEAPWLPGE
jgi:hypothetical protein